MSAAGLADLWHIRTTIVCCAVLATLAVGLATAAHLRLLETRSARTLAEHDLVEAQQRLLRTEAEQAEYLDQLRRYRDFSRRQQRHADLRLDWLAQLRQAAAGRHVAAMEYEFAPQTRVDTGVKRSPELRSSRMALRLELLHEEDLLGLFGDLRTKLGALLSVRACSIERIAGNAGGELAAALRAECSIDWLSLQEAK